MKKLLSLFICMCIFVSIGVVAKADYYSSYTTLKSGMQGSEVANLQKDLKSLGYFNYTISSYFQGTTKQSVINFQRIKKLPQDGIVGRATARKIKVEKVIKSAKSYQGVPYVWGGTSPSGFDCSGFVHYTFLKNGITIPRTTETLYQAGTPVAKSSLRRGYLVFFTTYRPGPSHVGIYLSNGKFLHASSGAGKITISSLDNSYFKTRFIGVRRVVR